MMKVCYLRSPLDNALDTFKAAYDTNKQTYMENKIREIKTAHITRKSKLAWATVNDVTNRKKYHAARPSGYHPSKRIKIREEHLKNFLGRPASLPPHPEEIDTIILETLPIPVHEFTMEELTSAIRSTSSGKATGLDDIPAEVCKSGALLEYPLNVCNKVFNSGEAPNIWRKAALLPIPKKGDLTNGQNYRGISLIPVATKIFNKMLHNRIKPHFEKVFRMYQNDFRAGRSTIGQILALRRIIEEAQINHLPAVLDFVDFRKAFDSVSRERLFDILAAYGVPQEIIKAIRAACTNTTAQVITEDGNTEFFPFMLEYYKVTRLRRIYSSSLSIM